MTDTEGQALLARKLAAGRAVVDPAALEREQVLHTAFSRAAERAMKLPLRVQSCTASVRSSAEIAESLPDNGLLLLTEGPEGGVGLVVVSPDALSCLIEVMTTGHLRDHAAPTRRPTRTDAAMAAGFVDAVLAEIAALFAESQDITWAGGFSYASHLPDPRPLAMLLEDPGYRTFRLQLSFGVPEGPEGDMRRGEMILIYPAAGRGPGPQTTVAGDAEPHGTEARQQAWAQDLERAVLPVTTEVAAVLARVTLPLSMVLQLDPGQSLILPPGALQAVQLEGKGDIVLCFAQLGQADGRRALRVRLGDASGSVPAEAMPIRPAQLASPGDQPLSRPSAALRSAAASAPPAPQAMTIAPSAGDTPLRDADPVMAMIG